MSLASDTSIRNNLVCHPPPPNTNTTRQHTLLLLLLSPSPPPAPHRQTTTPASREQHCAVWSLTRHSLSPQAVCFNHLVGKLIVTIFSGSPPRAARPSSAHTYTRTQTITHHLHPTTFASLLLLAGADAACPALSIEHWALSAIFPGISHYNTPPPKAQPILFQ